MIISAEVLLNGWTPGALNNFKYYLKDIVMKISNNLYQLP